MMNKTWMKRAVAIGLIALMAAVNPLQNLSEGESGAPSVARAAEADASYLGEVRLAVDEDPSKAKQILTDAGYEVIDRDLNEGAGSIFNDRGEQAVYMGIKRTDDPKKAIRDMKTMNMLGQYSYTGLKERIENNKNEAKETYKNLKSAIREYADNYKKNDLGAQTTHDLMNMYREDDSGKLIGDLFLENPDEEQVLGFFAEGNLHIITILINTLTYAVEKADDNGDTWIDRLSNVSSYNAVVKQFAKERFNTEKVMGEQKAEVEAIVESELDSTARKLLANWGEFRKIFTDAEDKEKYIDEFDGKFEDVDEMLEVSENANNVEAVKLAKSLPYGKKTVYDYFTVSTATFEKNIKNLYPLAYALSEGQRNLLDLMQMSSLFQAALIRKTAGEDRSVFDESMGETQDVIAQGEVVSVYDGVDRSIYSDAAAMTSRATANMSADAQNQAEIENSKNWVIGLSITTAVFGILGVVCFPLSDKLHTIYVASGYKNNKLLKIQEALPGLGKVLLVASAVLAVVTAVQFYRMKRKANNTKQLPIPEILVDYDVEGSSGRNVVYHVVKWNLIRDDGRADRGDLNGDAAREWLALYTTMDEGMGEPILADSIVAKTGKDGGDKQPDANYVPLTLFGRESIQNLVDETYSFNDDVGGIWMWYQKAGSSTETELEDDTDDAQEETLSGDKTEDGDDKDGGDDAADPAEDKEDKEASETGSNIGSGTMALGITGGAVGGLVIGLLIGVFFRRKKTIETK